MGPSPVQENLHMDLFVFMIRAISMIETLRHTQPKGFARFGFRILALQGGYIVLALQQHTGIDKVGLASVCAVSSSGLAERR